MVFCIVIQIGIHKCITGVEKMRKCIMDIETTGLSPTESRIVCIGVKDCDSEETRVFWNYNESEMVSEFLQYFHDGGFKEIIGYNVAFDIQHIFSKILKYRIRSNSFLTSSVKDLMAIVKNAGCGYTMNKPGKLDDWTNYLFGERKLEKGASVPELFEAGKIQKIIDYNKKDVELTFKLWQRIQEVMS